MSEKNTVNIGLKLADGTFYPVFDDDFRGSKRLVLTTVHDNQKSVQIDLYKGMDKEVFEDSYIGSLVIENLAASKKGAAEIELVMGIDESGNLNAQARDASTGEQQALSVSLESISQRADYEIPDFEMDKVPAAASEQTVADETIAGEPPTDERRTSYAIKEKKKRSPLAVILIVLLGLLLLAAAAGAVIWFFFPDIPRQFGIMLPAASEAGPSPEPSPSESPTVTEIETPAPSPESPSPSPVAEEPPAAAGEGVWYKVVWGDTLWDLSRTYYRDPFQYMKIADAPENTIPNPDLIFEHQRIFIPDK